MLTNCVDPSDLRRSVASQAPKHLGSTATNKIKTIRKAVIFRASVMHQILY